MDKELEQKPMTQQVVRARVTFPSLVSHTDDVTMDFIVEATGSAPGLDFAAATVPQVIIEDFFNFNFGGHPLSFYLSQDLSRVANASTIDWTDITAHLVGDPAGPPFRHDTFTLGAAGGGLPLPPQATAVIALRRDYGSDFEIGPNVPLPSDEAAIDQGAPATHSGHIRPRARDRGRLHFGPLNSTVVDATAGGKLDTGAFIPDLTAAIHSTYQTINFGSPNQFNLVQWSRRNADVQPVRWFFIDENMGVLRRRADVTTTRVHTYTAV